MPTWADISPLTGRPLTVEQRLRRAENALREVKFLLELPEMQEAREGYPNLLWWTLYGLGEAPEQQREVPSEVLKR
jgi:hypothetical protein